MAYSAKRKSARPKVFPTHMSGQNATSDPSLMIISLKNLNPAVKAGEAPIPEVWCERLQPQEKIVLHFFEIPAEKYDPGQVRITSRQEMLELW